VGELGAGAQYGRYRIQLLLGRGGFGAVYLADDPNPFVPRQVALKILKDDLSADPKFRERFLRESHVAIELGHHPNIVTIYDAGENDDGTLFMAMQYVEGTDLASYIAGRVRLDPETTAAIVAQVASVLDAAHAVGVVHRDVKPSNVLLSQDARVAYLADFGINKRMLSDTSLSVAGEFIGTLLYAAPEQLEGKPVDGRTDVYALGCVVYECLTGKPPFVGETSALVKAHLHDAPAAVTDGAPDAPAAINDVVRQAMAKKPDDRYATCGALAAAAERALSPEGATVRVSSPAPAAAPLVDEGATWTAGAAPMDQTGPPASVPPAPPWISPPPSAWPPSEGPPAAQQPSRRRWWLAAGIAAAVVVAGLVIAMARSGPDAFPNKNEKTLLNAVPADFRGTCKRATSDLKTSGTEAEVRCHPKGGADAVAYLRFRSRAELDKAYDRALKERGIARDTSDCSEFSEAEGPYAGEGNDNGRVFCYRDTGHSFMTWTTNEQRLLSRAERSDRKDNELYTWWAQLVGREESAEHPNAAGTTMTAEQTALLEHVPSSFRDTCHPGSASDLPGFVAKVTCGPTGGTDLVDYIQFRDKATMDQAYENVRASQGVETGTGPAGSCPHEAGYTVENVHKGRVLCFKTTENYARLDWTADDFSILSEAQRNDGDVAAFYQWWNNDGGPV